jgi:hypothetical protein
LLRSRNAGAQNLRTAFAGTDGFLDNSRLFICFSAGNRRRAQRLLARRLQYTGRYHWRYNMAKKILALALVFGLAFAVGSFASGQKEPGQATAPGAAGEGQKLVLTGTVAFQNLIHPTLKSGDKLYELMVPRFLVYQANLKEGAQVTVEGYEVRGMMSWSQGDDGNIDVFVTKATINGKEYDLSQFRGPRGGGYGYGQGRGMMGGPGRGYGMMGGYGRGGCPGGGF